MRGRHLALWHCISIDMELSWLRSFLILSEVLHFGRAADVLNMSQSALSVQIRHLEALLGVALFARDRRSVSLTGDYPF